MIPENPYKKHAEVLLGACGKCIWDECSEAWAEWLNNSVHIKHRDGIDLFELSLSNNELEALKKMAAK